jgi:hypothetical protein
MHSSGRHVIYAVKKLRLRVCDGKDQLAESHTDFDLSGTEYFPSSMEFIALANHRKALKAEIAYYAERFREEQRKALTTILHGYGVDPAKFPPLVWSVLMTSVSRVLVIEQALDMSAGHSQTIEIVESYLRHLEGDPEI